MRNTSVFLITFLFSCHLFGQTQGIQEKEAELRAEGENLYRSEMASWHGTDIFLAQFKDKQDQAGGYFSYADGDQTRCIFFSRADQPRVMATITFDASFDARLAKVDTTGRDLTPLEGDLYAIRQAALAEIRTDTLFKTYKNTNLNLIPLVRNNDRKVYVLTGPQTGGVVILGNDYLITFNEHNQVVAKKSLHRNIIPIDYAKEGQEVSTMHTHLPETGDYITATDVCTLLLYQQFARWKQHYVISQNNVSIWDCKSGKLVVLTREAWDRIGKHQKSKKKPSRKNAQEKSE